MTRDIKEWLKSGFDIMIKDSTALGATPFYLFLTILFLCLGYIQLFLWMILGFIIAHIVVIGIRQLFPKDRPKKRIVTNWIEKIDASSFPSHHSIRVTMLAVFFAYAFYNIYLTMLMAITALIVMFSRYYLKNHYLIDIICGAVFGVIISGIICWLI